jgi:hypothetical protein
MIVLQNILKNQDYAPNVWIPVKNAHKRNQIAHNALNNTF